MFEIEAVLFKVKNKQRKIALNFIFVFSSEKK